MLQALNSKALAGNANIVLKRWLFIEQYKSKLQNYIIQKGGTKCPV